MTPKISLIIPTRERAAYLEHSIRTCTDNPCQNLEILVLNNASSDDTDAVMQRVSDPRVRYVRNESRLSMRDNFEKGIELSRGDILCFIGDDDGVFPYSVDSALSIFKEHRVEAVSAARAHYFWPDLLAPRKNTALLPRGHGVTVLDSRSVLRHVLTDNDYYRLPCLYHGFVKRDVVERVKRRQGRFFLSSQVDIFSSIALSMEGILFAFSQSPLIINGGSSRSNGAAHSGGGAEQEKSLWKNEDDVGFLPGFADSLTIGALIVESAIRYGEAAGNKCLSEILEMSECIGALSVERLMRLNAGLSAEDAERPFVTAGIDPAERFGAAIKGPASQRRVVRLIRSFMRNRPIDMATEGVVNVHQAAQELNALMSLRLTGLFSHPLKQLRAAARVAWK